MQKRKATYIIGSVLIAMMATIFLIADNGADSEQRLERDLVKRLQESEQEQERFEKLFTRLSDELNHEFQNEIGLSFSFDDRIFTVQVENEEFKEEHEKRMKEIIAAQAKEHQFSDFNVEIMVVEPYLVIMEEDKKLMESNERVFDVISEVLKTKGFGTHYSASIDHNQEIKMVIEEKQEKIQSIEKLEVEIAQQILAKTNQKFKVNVRKKSIYEIQEQQWNPILNAIQDQTKKEFEAYRGFAYSFHPAPLQIIIKTNLEKKWFWKPQHEVKQIENYVEAIIKIKREELTIEEIPYEVIIRDRHNNQLN